MQLFSILISKQFNAVCVYDEWDQELEPLILMLGIRIINVVYLQNERDNENENSGPICIDIVLSTISIDVVLSC